MVNPLQTPPLLTLPAELLRDVIDRVSRQDAWHLRLACKALVDHANPLAFGDVHVWLEEQSLNNMLQLAQSSLSKHVRKLVFGLDSLAFLDYEHFKAYFYASLEDGISEPNKKTGQDCLESEWLLYQRCYEEQRALLTSGQDLVIVQKAIAAFSSLTTLNLMDYRLHELGPYECPDLMRKEIALRMRMLIIPNTTHHAPRSGRQLGLLLGALGTANHEIQHLSVQVWACNSKPNGFYAPFNTGLRRLTSQALAGLKTLELVLDPMGHMFSQRPDIQTHENSLTTMLRAATNLQSLSLEVALEDWEHWSDYVQISDFGKLRHLRIEGLEIAQASFTAFLEQSCQNLTTLSIHYGKVTERCWNPIFDTIRALPSLGKVDLYTLWYQYEGGMFNALRYMDARPIYDYLLHNRGDNPWDTMCQERYEDMSIEVWSSDEE